MRIRRILAASVVLFLCLWVLYILALSSTPSARFILACTSFITALSIIAASVFARYRGLILKMKSRLLRGALPPVGFILILATVICLRTLFLNLINASIELFSPPHIFFVPFLIGGYIFVVQREFYGRLLQRLEIQNPEGTDMQAEECAGTEEFEPSSFSTSFTIKLIEIPSGDIDFLSGEIEISDQGKRVLLAPLEYKFCKFLAEKMTRDAVSDFEPIQMGWVGVDECLEKLPWNIPHPEALHVRKLVNKIRNKLRNEQIDPQLIESKRGAGYRFSTPPSHIAILEYNSENVSREAKA